MTDRPTVWEPIPEPQDYQKPSNPKLRIVAMVIGLILMLGFVIYVTFLPRQYELQVSIDSTPQGAKVFIGDKERGTTPIQLSLSPAQYNIRLELEGFNTLTTNIDVVKENESYKYDLTNNDDTISITTIPDNADVYIDENYIGKSNLKYKRDLESIHKIRVLLQGFGIQEKMVDFSKERDIIFNLEKSYYKVSVKTVPEGAVLYVDEVYKGQTPITLDMPEGDHDFRLVVSGRKSMFKKIKVQTPLDLEYSFEDDGFTFDTSFGEDSAPGANVYLFHIQDGKINRKIPPLFVGTTPVSRSLNDIMTYMTADLKTRTGLVVANHPTLGTGYMLFEISEDTKISTQKFNVQLSGIASSDVFGQPVDKLDFNNISTEETSVFQDVTQNMRFKLIEQNGNNKLIDRDNYPSGQILLESKPEKIILSPDEKFIVAISKGNATLYQLSNGKKLTAAKGDSAFFALDSSMVCVYSKTHMTTITLPGLTAKTNYLTINGTLIPINNLIAAVTSKGKILSLIGLTDGSKKLWDELYPEFPYEPTSVVVRNIAGKDHVIILGSFFGIDSMIYVDQFPKLVYMWIPENAVDKLIDSHL